MRIQPVSEKALEILFIRYLLLNFGLGEIALFAPTSRDEYKKGYDARIIGSSSFQELYLQFKSPFYTNTANRFTVRTTEHQHKVLKELPSNYAYYIVSTIRSLECLMDAQRKAHNPSDFLRNYIAIELSSLHQEDVTSFHYSVNESVRKATVMYKCSGDYQRIEARNELNRNGWLWGDELLEKFKQNLIGVRLGRSMKQMLFMDDQLDSPENKANAFPLQLSARMDSWSPSDFGVQVRKIEA